MSTTVKPDNENKTWEAVLEIVRGAHSVRSLLTDDVKLALWDLRFDSVALAEAEADLRLVAKQAKFTKSFDSALKALNREIKADVDKSIAEEKARRKANREAENKISFMYLDNPYQHLSSYTYTVNDDGIFYGNERICTQPVLIIGKCRDIETGEDAFTIAYHDGSVWQTLTEKREILFSTGKIIRLAAYGLSVHSANAQQFIRFLDAFESENKIALIPKKSISRLGWFDGDRFAPYEPDLAFVGHDNRDLFEAVSASGSAEVWLSHVKELRNNLSFRLTIAASLASPLIKKAGALPFIYHIWGKSGCGKTVALMAAMSIWGDPSFGKLLKTLNATANYIINSATFYHSIPVAYDELQITGTQYANIESLIMMLTEGLNRGRMEYSKSQQTLPWKCSFLFSGEGPVLSMSSGGGVYNRVVEVECRSPVIENGNQTVNIIRENYGHAGKIFIDHLKNVNIPSMFRKQQAEILEQTGTTGKLAASMALMMIADRIAGECLFPGEKPLTIENIRPYLKTETDADISVRAYIYVCDLIAANVARFDEANHNELWGRIDAGICTFNKTILESKLRDGKFTFDAIKRQWYKKGYLVKNSQERYSKQTTINGVKAAYVEIVVDEDAIRMRGEMDELPL